MGGFNGTECMNTAECYNPDTNQWTGIAPMRNRRSGIGIIAHRNQIFAIGEFANINIKYHCQLNPRSFSLAEPAMSKDGIE